MSAVSLGLPGLRSQPNRHAHRTHACEKRG